MKKLFSIFAVIALMVACTENSPETGNNNDDPGTSPKPETTIIELDVTSVNFDVTGGQKKISFTTNKDWTAEVINDRADGWCSVNPSKGSSGDAIITIATDENNTNDDRTATIVIKAGSAQKTIKVSQKQKDALTVTASSFEVGADGGEIIIEVQANVEFTCEIEDSAKDWLIHRSTRSMSTSVLTFEVGKNDDVEKRKANIIISSENLRETITIYQTGTEPTIVISQNEYVVSADGTTIAVDVASNVDVSVELPSNIDWISENSTRGMSTNTYLFDIIPNEDYDQRTAEIKFINKENGLSEEVTVVQTQKDAIVLAKDSYTISSEGGQIEIEVGHNVDFEVEIANEWITKVETRAFVTETLVFNIDKNTNYENREGTIIFKSKDDALIQTVKVIQSQKNSYTYTGGDKTCAAAESSVSFSFSTTAGFFLDTDNTNMVEFLTTEQSSTGGDFNATVKVKKNESNSERTANIYISVDGCERELMFSITQSAPTIDDVSDEVLKYVDERLKEEYYWMEEYNEKRANFDFSLPADEYLKESLLSMTTNMADGGIDYRGNRYIYSYIYAQNAASAGTRAQSVSGYGIMLSTNYWAVNEQGTEFGLAVEHVYPDSPADVVGLKRGDIITEYNGKAITASNINDAWYDLYYSLSSNVSIGIYEGGTVSLTAGSYKENPVAASMVLELWNGPKVGYLSYLGFDSAYDSELIDAMRSLKENGAEEMILDLRLNGGGSVYSSTILGSMLLDASYNDKTYAVLVRNPANRKGPTTCKITSAYNGQSLPRLGIKRLFVIATDNTASASEMVISGLRGLGIEVMVIGTTTEGKNCGMDVINFTHNGVTYEYAPITFMNFNATSYEQYLAGQPYFDYPDGIEADCDMEYFAKNAQDATVKKLANFYPMPMEPWGESDLDVAMTEALMQIQGKSLLTFTSANAHKEINLQPAHKLANMTRAGEIELPTLERKFKGGATLTEEERIAFDSQAYK